MFPKSVIDIDKIQQNVNKPSFCKSLSLGDNWKSKSMRIIPEEFVKSTAGAFDHRVVFSVRWGNSWQLWLERDKKGLFMVEEDWDEFVDDNFLGPNDILFFTHEDTMFLQVRIVKKDGREIMSVPLEAEPESETPKPNPQNSHQETTSSSASAFVSASGATFGLARHGSVHVKNPERYLSNPKSPYFVKTLTKKNDVLYVTRGVIRMYDLKFGPADSDMTFILPEGKMEGCNKVYGGTPCFTGWIALCRRYNLKQGDSVVCELELSGGLVTAVRVHFVNE